MSRVLPSQAAARMRNGSSGASRQGQRLGIARGHIVDLEAECRQRAAAPPPVARVASPPESDLLGRLDERVVEVAAWWRSALLR